MHLENTLDIESRSTKRASPSHPVQLYPTHCRNATWHHELNNHLWLKEVDDVGRSSRG
jgi:hypothetical protein